MNEIIEYKAENIAYGLSVPWNTLSSLTQHKNILKQISYVQIYKIPSEQQEKNQLLLTIAGLRKIYQISFSIHVSPRVNLAEKVDAIRAYWISECKEYLLYAHEINASFVNLHLGYGIGSRKYRKHALATAADSLNELSATLDAIGSPCNIHIENIYKLPREADFFYLGDRTSDFNAIFRDANNRVHLCFDYGHANLDELGFDILTNHKDRVGSLHLHDNNQQTDQHNHVAHHQGTINWNDQFMYLVQERIQVPMIFEGVFKSQLRSIHAVKKIYEEAVVRRFMSNA